MRKERAKAQEGLEFLHLTGSDLREAHWDAFWRFYQDTGSRKWGRPYLTRNFFSLLGERMADKVLLMIAQRNGRPIAGALNLIGSEALYGRYWGCAEDVPFLHFELCYYQAIDAAIARGLSKVEAGAQGEHKLSRGYRPTATYSAHYIPNASFRRAVADYVEREAMALTSDREWLGDRTPFRRGETEN
jgi:predicted N-acyltransferase